MKRTFRSWLEGDLDLLSEIPDAAEVRNLSRRKLKEIHKEERSRIRALPVTRRVARLETRAFQGWYRILAVGCCVALLGVFLFMTAHVTRYGEENPRASEVADRYLTRGVEETGAINAVAGMILDYRAFDTLGESHVLFTALICVMVLLQRDSKNMRPDHEDYFRIRQEWYYPTERDPILRRVGMVLGPGILMLGCYILLGGHLGPGGGFSGGAVLGTGLVILASALGDETVDRILTGKRLRWISFLALCFYSLAKGYVFFTGANGLENHIPKGTPGAILSAGLILPLDIAVGLVVGCTMFGFYSLFRRGSIGGQ